MGDQSVQTTTYSVITSTFASNREKILGYLESASGVGLLIGPLAGEFINSRMGYLPSFMFFAGLLGLAGLLNLFLLPSSLNGAPIVTEEEFKELEE